MDCKEPKSVATLLVFSDDWGRHPSSCQHLIRRFVSRYEVVWVNTIGMRRPALNLSTMRRGLEKAMHWIYPASRSDSRRRSDNNDGPRVISPRMWPTFSSQFARNLNRRLLSRVLDPILTKAKRPVIAITTIPIVADLMGTIDVDCWIYYCVDDFGKWPGLDQKVLSGMELEVIKRADRLIAVSDTLCDRLRALGRESTLLTHGVDVEFWTSPGNTVELPSEFVTAESPRVVFWGVIDQRLDVESLLRLATDMNYGSIILVGPQDQPCKELFSHPRIKVVPPVPYETLPALASASDVLIMPYADLPVTRAMQPLKLKEYLATGKPVVVRALPSTRAWRDCLDETESPEEFSKVVREHLSGSCVKEYRYARQRVRSESWNAKAEEFERLAVS